MRTKKHIRILAAILLVSIIFVSCGCSFLPDNSNNNDAGYTIAVNSVKGVSYSSLADTVKTVQGSVVEVLADSSAGSGVFFGKAADGYSFLLTCHHVIEGAKSVVIKVYDGRSFTAQVVGGHYESDIAVLRIAATEGIVYANIRDGSAELRAGEEVFVIGNPLGTLGGSVSGGIISSPNRTINVEGVSMELLQTDASINKGNSGGAIFDKNGALIGIVNAKSLGEGLGFAIPIESALKIADHLTKTFGNKQYNGFGYVEGDFLLGISAADDNIIFNSQSIACAWISGIHSDSFLYGFVNAGDYVESVSFNNQATKINSAQELLNYFKNKKIGDKITLAAYRTVRIGIRNEIIKKDPVEVTVVQYVYRQPS